MLSRLVSMFSSGYAAPAIQSGGGVQPLMPIPRNANEWNRTLTDLFGAPDRPTNYATDRAVSQVYGGPYQGPLDLDRYGQETREQRYEYRQQFSKSPVFRAAIRGKANDIASLEPTYHVHDKTDLEANDAAEFVKRTIDLSPGGHPGLIDNIYLAASLDGYSVCEWKLEEQVWNGRRVWGLAHVRALDTVHIRFQLDVFYNVIGVVNMVRGLEYYDPKGYILYSHHGMFNSPFGQSDGRAAITAAKEISEVYKLWYVAQKVYGLPYMVGKTNETKRQLMETALDNLQSGGWAVLTSKDDSIDTLDMAVGAMKDGFEHYVNVRRQDIFYGVRLAALPFLEGKGGQDAHGSSKIEQGTSDAGEKMDAHRVADVINRQLIPRLIEVNYPNMPRWRMPMLKLGGTDWEQTQKIIAVYKGALEIGMDPSAEGARTAAGIQAARGPDDRLVTPEEKQQQQQQVQAQQQAAQAALQPQQPAAVPKPPASGDQNAQPPTNSGQKPAVPAAKPPGDQKPPTTFSADHAPAVDPEQVARVVGKLLEEMAV